MKILIGMPSCSGLVPTQMVTSLLQLIKPGPTAFMTIDRQRVDKARNAMVKECLDKGFDYLFMVDDDNPIPPETLKTFIKDDKDIVIAPILARNPNKDGKYNLCAFYSKKVKGETLYLPIEEFKTDNDLEEVDAGGTGCMLIKRKVLEKLWKKYEWEVFKFTETIFKEPIKVDGVEYKKRTMSEDCEFSERAKKEGFKIYLDKRIKPIHFCGQQFVKWEQNNG